MSIPDLNRIVRVVISKVSARRQSRREARRLRVDREVIEKYFVEEKVRKLHLGCGDNILSGWLNSDYYHSDSRVIHVDATKAFPFANSLFDYVFSEHMIEHVSYLEGRNLLTEAYRVLKPGGKIRISTPDLAFLVNLYGNATSELQDSYIRWSSDRFIGEAPFYKDTFVINNFFQNWGHKFIYDEYVLRASLEKAGFIEIARFDLQQSGDGPLRNLENESRMPAGFLELETITLEGTKNNSELE